MKSTDYDGYLGPRLSREAQLRRVKNVMERELTERQRMIVEGVYFQRRTMTSIARELGVNKSTVCRTFHRAEARIRRLLRY